MNIIFSHATPESYKVYQTYQAMKRHFETVSYDYFKYRGKTKTMSWENFQTDKSVFPCARLAKEPDWHNKLLANLIHKPKSWIGEISTDETIYPAWKKRTSALTYLFTSELNVLDYNYFNNLSVVGGQHPQLITLCLQRKISFETFTILCQVSKVYDAWNEELTDKIIAKPLVNKAKKYAPFLELDEKKFKGIVKEKFF